MNEFDLTIMQLSPTYLALACKLMHTERRKVLQIIQQIHIVNSNGNYNESNTIKTKHYHRTMIN